MQSTPDLVEELYPRHEKRTKIRPKRQETDMKLDFDEWYAEVEGIVRCFAQIETTKG